MYSKRSMTITCRLEARARKLKACDCQLQRASDKKIKLLAICNSVEVFFSQYIANSKTIQFSSKFGEINFLLKSEGSTNQFIMQNNNIFARILEKFQRKEKIIILNFEEKFNICYFDRRQKIRITLE